jgi:hypothetical protein
MHLVNRSFEDSMRLGPFGDALHDNLELLSELLDAIGAECAQVDERAAALFFEGIAAIVDAFSREYFDRRAVSADWIRRRGFSLTVPSVSPRQGG